MSPVREREATSWKTGRLPDVAVAGEVPFCSLLLVPGPSVFLKNAQLSGRGMGTPSLGEM